MVRLPRYRVLVVLLALLAHHQPPMASAASLSAIGDFIETKTTTSFTTSGLQETTHHTLARRKLSSATMKWTEIHAVDNLYACGISAKKAYGWGGVIPVYTDSGIARSTYPIIIAKGSIWQQLAPASGFICGLRTNGTVTCWGTGVNSATSTYFNPPKTWPGIWKYIAGNAEHVCAIDSKNELYCSGKNSHGEVGSEDVPLGASVENPVRVTSTEKYSSVSCGKSHTCAITLGGALYCFGENVHGQCGIDFDENPGAAPTAQMKANGAGPLDILIPTQVSGDVRNWTQVSCGREYTCGIDTSESIFCFGKNSEGQTTAAEPYEDEPQPLASGGNWKMVSAGYTTTFGIRSNGDLYGWGSNNNGNRGDGIYGDVKTPRLISANYTWTYISAGETFSCGLTDNNSTTDASVAWCWGDNSFGFLGTGDLINSSVPIRVSIKNVTRDDDDDSDVNVGAIVGGIFGALAFLALIGGLFYWRKKKKSVTPTTNDSGDTTKDLNGLELGQARPGGVIRTNTDRNISPSPFAEAAANGDVLSPDTSGDIDSASVLKNPMIGNDPLLRYIQHQKKVKAAIENGGPSSGGDSQTDFSDAGSGPSKPVDSGGGVSNITVDGINGIAAVASITSPIKKQLSTTNGHVSDVSVSPSPNNLTPAVSESSLAMQTSMERQATSSSLIDIRPWVFDFDQLEILRVLGEGSFGRVYLAKWHETPVAVKVLLEDPDLQSAARLNETNSGNNITSLSSPMLGKLKEEAAIMAKLRHPNIVSLFGICTQPPCIATEYCRRGSLYQVLRDAGAVPQVASQLTWLRRIHMALDTAKAMLFLHRSGIIHRDLKSPNLLVSVSYEIKVTDFNLSRIMEDAYMNMNKSSTAGAFNPRWLAPELLESANKASKASDVFSYGIVLWELLTWELPWANLYPWAIAHNIQKGDRPPIPAPGDLPGMVAESDGTVKGLDQYIALMKRCWAQEIDARPEFDDVIQSLKEILSTVGAGREIDSLTAVKTK